MKTLILASTALAALAQTSFETASIKPSAPGMRGFSIIPSAGGRLTAKNITLKGLLGSAYHVQDFQVTGGPRWMDSDPYDIVAKAEGNPNEHQLMELLQPLLKDRFQVACHWETKQLPRYILVAGKGGSRLTEVKADGEPQLNIRGRKLITGHRAPLSQLVETLSWVTGRVVVDQTELKGVYDFKLEWTPDDLQISEPGGANGAAESANSLFAAIQEQLGLKLDPQKGPVQMLVVDRAEKATEN